MNKGYGRVLRLALAGSAAGGALLFAGAAWAQAVAIDVPAQPLADAFRELGKETGVNILFSPSSVGGRRAVAVKGSYTPLEAARRLAAQSDLEVVEDGSGAIIVRPKAATAQPTSDSSVDQSAQVEELVVTGSRLRRTTFDAPTPMVDLERTDLLESGYTDLGEALTDLPGIDIGVNLSTSQTAVQDNGLSTVSLRSLGQNRTLTLIDGRRTVSNAGNKNAVSLSSIPEFFVDRVEVITGGASAVYGSDAVSGVVNIITENNIDGFRARAVAGVTEHGGGSTTEYSVGYGRKFLGDRLSITAAATIERQNILRARDRSWAQRSVSFDPATNTLTGPDLSSITPGGRYRTNAFYFDETGMHSNFVTAVNGYDTRINGTLITPADYSSGALKISYDINDNLRVWGQFLASEVETNSVREPYGPASTTTFGVNDEFTVGNISRNNPFVPADIRNAATTTITWRRRMTEVGQMEIFNRRTTLRGWLGIEGTVFGDWDWHLTYGYGEYDGYQSRNNGINLQNLKYALDAESVGGEIRCRNAAARDAGCVALNPFGVGSITPEMADYIRANAWYRPQNRLDTVEGYMTGTLFELPAGPVDVAVGFEMRREKTRTLTDDVTEQGLSNFAYIPRYNGLIEAKEAFVEASVPLVRDMPFAYRLEVEGAVRVADYNLENVGTTLSYRAGVQWAPVKDVTFRAAWSRAQRAPDTTELYSPPRDDFDDVIDICNNVTATTAGTIAANCRADPGIAQAIANAGVFTQEDDNINAPNGGNANLKEETADTLTVGFVIRPSFLPKFDFSLDYYDIKVKDAISSLSNSQQLLECYSATVATSDNPFCDVIIRDAEGQLTKIFNLQDNLNDLRARGIDVAMRYRFDLDALNFPGDFTFKVNYSRRLELEQDYDGIQGLQTSKWLGEVGTSEHEAKASLAWRNDNWYVQWSTTYIGEAVDSNERVAAAKAANITNPLYLDVDAYWRNDLSVRFYPKASNKDLRVFGTIRNVFDNSGPFLPSGTDSGGSYNYSAVYGVTGRAYSLGLQLAF